MEQTQKKAIVLRHGLWYWKGKFLCKTEFPDKTTTESVSSSTWSIYSRLENLEPKGFLYATNSIAVASAILDLFNEPLNLPIVEDLGDDSL